MDHALTEARTTLTLFIEMQDGKTQRGDLVTQCLLEKPIETNISAPSVPREQWLSLRFFLRAECEIQYGSARSCGHPI
jgi:hypothetical protein